MSKTLFEKIWNSHVVEQLDEDLALIYIDKAAQALEKAADPNSGPITWTIP